ncbi:hypothetical protein ACTIVE_8815 [Actinomadura verrucosospora]|uniref:Uncharacterized protein n=1 Tax=Actinomadura verrucosospora TaxID=46165 RepID=A0A7D3ZV95_ACTVE|nr:hypothetical protein ACTIVE_8815 [Actinomadura verrucosospora]
MDAQVEPKVQRSWLTIAAVVEGQVLGREVILQPPLQGRGDLCHQVNAVQGDLGAGPHVAGDGRQPVSGEVQVHAELLDAVSLPTATSSTTAPGDGPPSPTKGLDDTVRSAVPPQTRHRRVSSRFPIPLLRSWRGPSRPCNLSSRLGALFQLAGHARPR